MSSSASPDPDPEDPITYFLEDMEFHGRSERTRDGYERVLRSFESFLGDRDTGPGNEAVTPAEATHRHCMAWVHSLREDLADGTVAIYAANVHRFYAYLTQVGVFDANPMTLVLEEMDETIDRDPARREVSVPEMRRFVARVRHPLHRAIVVTLLKTGVRVGELCNLDLRDLHLESLELEGYDLTGRPQLSGRPESLYVDGEPARGEVYNEEERTESNKRKRPTVIPVDDELRRVLRAWLAIRPSSTPASEPLFVATRDNWGERLSGSAVRHIVTDYAREHGWYESGAGAGENVTPHYFRHFFTTHLRERTGDRGVVKYLRGDVADDIIDTYTHNWGDSVRQTYLENVYSLL